jgi:hypothetical protein
MNTYHLAINTATSNGKFTEMGDLWRSYHSFSKMTDNDYQKSVIDSVLDRSEVRRDDERRNGQTSEKILYVPVTRKVSPPAWKNQSDLHNN